MEGLSSTRPIAFLGLPVELRCHIYRYCLVRKDPINVNHVVIDKLYFDVWGICDREKSLLLVSKKVGAEALEVLYGDNVFQVYVHQNRGYHLERQFTDANRQMIRSLQIVVQPRGCFYDRPLNSALWSPILAHLKKLSIVAQQPLQPRPHYDTLLFEHEMARWTDSLRAILQYVSHELRRSSIIEVDDDDVIETSILIMEYFPQGYRKVQTLAGNLLQAIRLLLHGVGLLLRRIGLLDSNASGLGC